MLIAQANHNALVLIPSGPALAHNYLETLEAVASDERRVITWDPIGTGASSASTSSQPSMKQQLQAVLAYLKIKVSSRYCRCFTAS
jgi:pimeloyl-ACP methyl ester carboxylesterase